MLKLCLGHKENGRRTVLSNFADSKILRNRSGAAILPTQSQIKGAPDSSFFGNAVSALFSSERHQTEPGRTLVGDRTDIGQQPDGARTDIVLTELPTGHRAVAVRRTGPGRSPGDELTGSPMAQ